MQVLGHVLINGMDPHDETMVSNYCLAVLSDVNISFQRVYLSE